ncbi:MAG: AAA family ATPase [Chloroflexi bacterium]|nr:AAA family ATPase [Chloroflexota bacterium]
MRCAVCGTEHADSARFCGACGASVVPRCPQCGEATSPGLRFCTRCGAALEPDRRSETVEDPEPSAERRRVSVLFVDLEDFTTLAETLDPEEVRTVQSRYFETARSVIARFDGTLEKFIGDAVVAIWGAPLAHEDDTDRSVGAALALVHEIGRLGGAAARHRLAGRASVATGEAAISVGSVGQGMVAGDLVNVAARLQGHAPSGGVLVDEITRLLAPEAAMYEPAGELQLKGRARPVLAHHARPRDVPAAGRGTHGGPFVGRDQELRELVELFDGVVRDHRPRLVSISGIAGIGKSRLAWELFGALGARPAPIAWHAGRAPAYGENITFAAVAEMVRHRIGAPGDTSSELTRRQLAASLSELVRDDEERRWLEPRVAALLGEERLDAFERDELFAAWRRYFERVSEASPVVLVFEDLQWADPALAVDECDLAEP